MLSSEVYRTSSIELTLFRRLSSVDHMSTLGSTQNRNTSFRPHHTRLSPTSARELTLSHLLAATAQVGHSTSSLKPANQPYIYGTRHKLAIIDVETATIPALRRAAAVVRSVCERDGVVLFVGTRPGQQASVLAATKRLGGNGFHVTAERWMPGVITNAPKLLAPAILKSLQGTHVLEAPNTTKLASQTLQPDLVILLNPIENAYALREATQANIPTIAITDTDVDPRSVTYPIPANDDSLRTAELIIGVLSKAGQEGLRERQLKLDEADKQRRRIARQKRLASGTSFDPRMRGQQASPAPAPAPSSD